MERRYKVLFSTIAVIAAILVISIALMALKPGNVINTAGTYKNGENYTSIQSGNSTGGKIQIVAAENFWGSLVSQLCGVHCNVTSIVSDPNADPHGYEASANNARAISNAKLVIVNGAGYDGWALKLLSVSNNSGRIILNVAQLLGIQNGSNPHLWYDPAYVNATVKEMYLDLVKIDPSNAGYYKQRYSNVTASLGQVDSRMAEIRQKFGGTKVASTESVFVYLANATGLDLISPPEFMEAVAEGNDPSVQSISEFQNQLESGNVSVLVYNEQTVTPLTQQMKQIAVEHNVTVIGITETIQPPDITFQAWMASELIDLQDALNANTLGH